MKQLDPEARNIRKEQEDKVDAVVRKNGALIAKALFATPAPHPRSRRYRHSASNAAKW